MEKYIWLIIMIPCSMLFSCIGIYAWHRKKPMWFWSGTTVKDEEISDVVAYNHANGLMWGLYSLIYWVSAVAGIWSSVIALGMVIIGCVFGIPALVMVYKKIYAKYKA